MKKYNCEEIEKIVYKLTGIITDGKAILKEIEDFINCNGDYNQITYNCEITFYKEDKDINVYFSGFVDCKFNEETEELINYDIFVTEIYL